MDNLNKISEENKTEIQEDASNKNEEKMFTQSELEEILNRRFAKERKKQEQEAEKAKALAQMNAEEKLRYELDEKDKIIAEYEAKTKMATLQARAIDTTKELGIDTALAKFIVGSNEDETTQKANELKMVWETAIKVATDKALAGVTPVKPAIEEKVGITKEEFKKMSLVEQQNLYVNNRELYNKVSR